MVPVKIGDIAIGTRPTHANTGVVDTRPDTAPTEAACTGPNCARRAVSMVLDHNDDGVMLVPRWRIVYVNEPS